MRALGLQDRLTCEGVLHSARSIEAAFAPPVPSVSGLHRVATSSTRAENAESLTAAREAAVERSRNLLNFVDRCADQLLVESGNTGRWFVDGPGNGHGAAEDGGIDKEPNELSVSSGSESEDPDYEIDYMDGEEEEDEREERKRAEQGRLERERERRERQKARAAAATVRSPPANDFVEELCSIAWLPVHAKATNHLLPWKVGVVLCLLPARTTTSAHFVQGALSPSGGSMVGT